jgi:hypothetical protein
MKKRKKSTGGRQKEHSGLSKLAEARLRRALRRTTPSESWVDAQFFSVVKSTGDEQIVVRMHDPHSFPPGGARTTMKRCPLCGVMTPTFAFEGGICLDHAEKGNWGRSPSAMAIAALQHMHLRLVDTPLPSESTAALRAEIARFEEKQARRMKKT